MHSRRSQGARALPPLSLTLLGAALFGSALGGCAEQPSGGSAPLVASASSAASAAPSDAAPFDVASAIERARASFYERDGLLVAGAETHRVELASGAFTFVPAHDTARETLAGLETLPTRSPSAEARRTTSSGSLIARSTRIEAETGLGAATAWVGRGSLRADGQLGEIRTVDGAVLMVRGSLVEELRNTREGLEQSWHFAAAPAGQEDLVVRVSTSGMTHVATTSTGEHFADSATGLGVRYGHGTFVDANGVRTAVPVAFEGGELVLRVPSEVIDEAAYPAVLDPTISAEITIDAPVTGPRGGNQVQPAIASNGVNTYLVVFTDGLFGEDDVRGARFGADGTLIDGNSFPIALATGTNQSNPAVTWNGTSWIVAWQDGRNTVDWDIYTTTVSSTGAVGAVDGVALAATAGVNEQAPSLASAGATTLAAYRSGDDASSDVVGLRLNATGVATDAVPFVIGGGAGVQTTAQVAASATAFLVSFDDDVDGAGGTANAVRVRRVNAAGTALPDATSTLIAANAFGGTVGWSGATTYLIAWTGLDAGFYAIFTGTVPVTGAIAAPAGVEVTPGALNRDYLEPRLAWNGSEYLLAYLDAFYDTAMMAFTSATVGARRLTTAGAASGAAIDPTSISATTNQVDVASIGSSFYLVYTDQTGDTDIRGTRITGTTVSTPAGQLLSSGPNDQTSPVVASSGTGWAVAWMDFRSAAVDAWAAILDTNGAVSGAPALIASGVGTQGPTGIAWAGSRYLVVYDDAGANIRAVTMTGAGIASAPFDIAVSTTLAALEGSVACGPAAIGCLVTFTEYDTAVATVDTSVRARRVDASTPIATVGAPITVVAAADNQFDSDVAASNTGFYVVWTDARTPTDVAIRGTRFRPRREAPSSAAQRAHRRTRRWRAMEPTSSSRSSTSARAAPRPTTSTSSGSAAARARCSEATSRSPPAVTTSFSPRSPSAVATSSPGPTRALGTPGSRARASRRAERSSTPRASPSPS